MEQQPQMGFRAQIREILSTEATALVPVTEYNHLRFEKTIQVLDEESAAAGMLPWPEQSRGLWVFGAKEANLADPAEVAGFVNVYEPAHFSEINEWRTKAGLSAYEPGAVVEIASFARAGEENATAEDSALKQALAKVFLDEPFKDVRAVSVWETHDADNRFDPEEASRLKSFGGRRVGSLRYAPQETVDSSCFIIPRKAFLDSLTSQK